MLTNLHEALRYAGVADADDAWLQRIKSTAESLEAAVHPRFVWRHFLLEKNENGILLSGTRLLLKGHTASRMLENCTEAVLLAATLGTETDAMIRTASARAMDEALLLDACGSALIEAVCSEIEKEISAAYPGYYLTDRFSPGYGDLSLEHQTPLLEALDARRRCGIFLTASSLMIPSKSVTAVIGLSQIRQKARIRGCAYCMLNKECSYRKEGKRCVD